MNTIGASSASSLTILAAACVRRRGLLGSLEAWAWSISESMSARWVLFQIATNWYLPYTS